MHPVKAPLIRILNYSTIIGCCALAGILSELFIILVRHKARFIAWGTIHLFCIVLTIITAASFYTEMPAFGTLGSILVTITVALSLIFRKKYRRFLWNHKGIKQVSWIVRKTVSIGNHAFVFSRSILSSRHHFSLPIAHFATSLTTLMFFANNIKLISRASSRHEVTSVFYLLHFVNFFGWLWTSNFVNGLKNIVLSGSFASWYWSPNKEPRDSVTRSIATVRV